MLWSEEHANYPLTLSVDDRNEEFELTAHVSAPVDPRNVCR